MRLRLLSLLLFTKVCHLNTVNRDICPSLPSPPNFVKSPPSGKHYAENESLRYYCMDGYVRKAGTSSLLKCQRVDGVVQWSSLNLECIPDPKNPNPVTPSTTHQTPTTYCSVSTSVRPKPTSLGPLTYQTGSSVTVDQTVTTVRMTTTTIDDITSAPVDKSTVLTTIPLTTVSNQIQTSTDSPSVDVGTKRSAIAISSGLGSVVLIILIFALIILLLWRRKRRQHLGLLPTLEEQMVMNGRETQP